ncbi:MAG: oligosaccharide flippase family protein [Bacteriovorax sp.]|nr:oligosaccharide flippase family protein [Bacteriovorax sp.]
MKLNKSLFFLIFGRIVQAFLAIATMKFATYYLSPKEMGNYYVLSSIATLFGIILISPMGQFVNRKFHSWYDNGILFQRLFTYNYYVIGVSLLSIPIVYIAKKYFGFVTDISLKEVIVLSVASIYLNTWFGTIVPAFNMLEKRISFTWLTLVNLAGSLVLSIVLVKTYGSLGTWWYAGQYIVFQAAITIFALWFFMKMINEKIVSNLFRLNIKSQQVSSVIKFSLPLMIATFFMWLLNDSYRFIVEKMLGLEVLGNLAVSFSVSASIFALLESLFQQIYYPRFYRKITSDDARARLLACQELIDIAFPAFCFTSVFLVCSAPFILRLLTSSAYSNSWVFVIFGCGISLARVLTNIITSIAHSELNTKKLIAPYVVGGILTVALMTGLLKIYQNHYIIGFVLLCMNLVVLLLMKHHMFKIIKAYIPWKSLFEITLFSIPFLMEIFLWENNNLFNSFIVVGGFGIYYLFILFKKFSRTLVQS